MTQLGNYLIEEDVITRAQLDEALERQLRYGQRLGDNLVALGYLSPEEMAGFLTKAPVAPKTVADAGLDLIFIAELALKHAIYMGEFGMQEMAGKLCLPVSTAEEALEYLRGEKLVEVTGAELLSKSSFRFKATGLGKARAGDLFNLCGYCGPAPVPLEDYCRMVEFQNIRNVLMDENALRSALEHLTLPDSVYHQLGPALSSGRPIFLFGPPGNGKTAIALAISAALPGTVFVPHAVLVGGQIIYLYDKVNHKALPTKEQGQNFDRRWVEISRPVLMTGGELTLKMLELQFNEAAKTYEAPLQMKANNGILVIDDFGRQQLDLQAFLNRWIVSLERNIDFLSLHTGMKLTIPFNQIVMFSTNLEPKTLVDEAFLRRIRYKIKVDYPTEEAFSAIFRRVCEENGLEFWPEVLQHLKINYYQKHNIPPSSCHARDIVSHIIDHCRYHNLVPQFSTELAALAWENYFLEGSDPPGRDRDMS